MDRGLDTLKANLSSLKVDCALPCCDRIESGAKIAQLYGDLWKALNTIYQQSVDVLAHMVEAFQSRLVRVSVVLNLISFLKIRKF